jgi:hypothetical protein
MVRYEVGGLLSGGFSAATHSIRADMTLSHKGRQVRRNYVGLVY